VFAKCALEGDDSGKLDKALGEFALPFDEEYKQQLLDETKLKVRRHKSKPQDSHVSVPPLVPGAPTQPGPSVQTKEKKKKHKKKPMAKNVDKSTPADPERWLAKWKRAKYRKQFKRLGKFRETQGDVVAAPVLGACMSKD
jgi:hypothetical protein